MVYLEKAFDGTPWRPAERLPVARELGETSLMMLVHPTLIEAEMDKACAALAVDAWLHFNHSPLRCLHLHVELGQPGRQILRPLTRP